MNVVLPERIQNGWNNMKRCHPTKSHDKLFAEFKIRWDEFKGRAIDEFLTVNDSIYREWSCWYYNKNDFSFTEAWNEFKTFWHFDTAESKLMFEEMEKIKMSHDMHYEWRMKYNFEYPHVYEKDEKSHYIQKDYELKSKAQLWDDFKEIWEIDIEDYNEYKYYRMNEYVNDIQREDGGYFYLYCEDSNYHSFDSYSLLEQFEICEDYDSTRTPKVINDESESNFRDESINFVSFGKY